MMKKWCAAVLSMLLIVGLTACNKGENTDSGQDYTENKNGVSLRENITLAEIVNAVADEFGTALSTDLNEEIILDLVEAAPGDITLTPEDIESFSGKLSRSNISADHILAFHMKEGKAKEMETVLEARRASVEKVFQNYLPDQYEKASSGQVIVKGDYVFLLIVGNPQNGIEKEIKKAAGKVESFFS